MKPQLLVLIGVAMSAQAHAANAPALAAMRADCVELVQNTLAAASGADQLTPQERQTVTVTHSHLIAQHTNAAGTTDNTYKAQVNGNGLVGTVVVTASRGGCYIDKLNIQNTAN